VAHYLLYDDACSLCVRFKETIQRWDRRRAIDPVPFTDFRIPKIVPRMTRGQLENSFHLVFPDGRVESGDRAIPSLLALLPGGKPIAWLLRILPSGKWLCEKTYAWIVSRRKGPE